MVKINFLLVFVIFKLIVLKVLDMKRNRNLFFEPDFEIKEIPEKWRQMCGFRYKPYIRRLNFSSKCFAKEFTKQVIEPYEPPEQRKSISPRIQWGRDAVKHESPWTVQLAARHSIWFGLD